MSYCTSIMGGRRSGGAGAGGGARRRVGRTNDRTNPTGCSFQIQSPSSKARRFWTRADSRDGRRRHGAELRAPLALTVPELVAALAGCLVGRLPLNEKEIIAAGQMKGRGTVVNPLMVVRGARRSCPPARLPTGLSATPILNKLVTFKGRNSPTRSITQRRERDMPSHAHVHVVSLIFKTS